MIEEELDSALERQAAAERTSKAALIRRYVRERLRPLPPIEEDPLWDLVGMVEGNPDDSASVDDVVYGPNSSRPRAFMWYSSQKFAGRSSGVNVSRGSARSRTVLRSPGGSASGLTTGPRGTRAKITRVPAARNS